MAEADSCAAAAQLQRKVQQLVAHGRLEQARLELTQAQGLCPEPPAELLALHVEVLSGCDRHDEALALARRIMALKEVPAGAEGAARRAEQRARDATVEDGLELARRAAAAARAGQEVAAARLCSRALTALDRQGLTLTLAEPPRICAEALAFAPDGKRAAVTDCGDLSVRRIPTLEEELHLTGPDSSAAVAFSADGRLLAWATEKDVRIADSGDGSLKATLTQKMVTRLQFSPAGSVLATSSLEEGLALWDTDSWQRLKAWPRLNGHDGLAFSADGATLAAVAFGGVDLIDVATRRRVRIPASKIVNLHSAAFSADGKTLAMVGFGGATETWYHASPRGSFPITNWLEQAVEIWDVAEHKRLGFTVRKIPDGPATPGWQASPVAMLRDGSAVFTKLMGRETERFSSRPFRLEKSAGALPPLVQGLLTKERPSTYLLPSPDGTHVLEGGRGRVTLWQVKEPWEAVSEVTESGRAKISDLAVSADGRRLVAVADGTIVVWDIATGAHHELWSLPQSQRDELRQNEDTLPLLLDGQLPLQDLTPKPAPGYPPGVHGKVVAFSPDGGHKVVVNDSVAHVVDRPGRQAVTLADSNYYDYRFTFSPDRRLVAGVGYQGARLWDAQSGRILKDLDGPAVHYQSNIVFSPDGKRVAAGSADAGVRVWDLASRRELTTARQPSDRRIGSATLVRFTADGKQLVSAPHSPLSSDGAPCVWDGFDGAFQQQLRGMLHEYIVVGLTMIPDSAVVAAATTESIAFWRLPDGELLGRLFLPNPHVALLLASAGDMALMGDPSALPDPPSCRVKAWSFPFGLCEQRLLAQSSLLRRLITTTP